MTYNYLLEIYPAETDEIITGCVHQTRHWIDERRPQRLQYLGEYKDEENSLKCLLILTGLSKPVLAPGEMYELLKCFASDVNFPQELALIYCLNIIQISTQQAKICYEGLKGKVYEPEFMWDRGISATEETEFYSDIKSRYYDYHLEWLLDKDMKDAFDAHFAAIPTALTPNEASQVEKSRDNYEKKAQMIGTDIIPIRWEGRRAVFGKFHCSACPDKVFLPNYTCKITDVETVIDEYAFDGCDNLQSVVIQSCITEIGEYAFRGCTNLTNLDIPKTVRKVAPNAFEGCENLKVRYV